MFACGICVKLQINYRRCIAIKTCFGMGRALVTVLISFFYRQLSVMKYWGGIILI